MRQRIPALFAVVALLALAASSVRADTDAQSMMLPPTVGRPAIQQRIGALAQGIETIELRVQHIGVIDGVVFVERVDAFVYRGKHGECPVVGVVDVEKGRVKAWR